MAEIDCKTGGNDLKRLVNAATTTLIPLAVGVGCSASASADQLPTLGSAHPSKLPWADGLGTARPVTFSLASTGSSTVRQVVWDSWGGAQATGHGLTADGAASPNVRGCRLGRPRHLLATTICIASRALLPLTRSLSPLASVRLDVRPLGRESWLVFAQAILDLPSHDSAELGVGGELPLVEPLIEGRVVRKFWMSRCICQ